MPMKKFVNLRPAVLLAFAIGAGAGLSYISVYNSVPLWWAIAAVPAAAVAVIVSIVRRSAFGITLALVCAALFAYGVSGVYLRLEAYCDTSIADGAACSVGGVVYEKSFTQNGEYIKLDSVTADGERVSGGMIVYLDENYGEFCDVGYSVELTATVYVSSPFAYGAENSSRLLEDVRYSAYQTGKLSSEYGFSLFGGINSAIRSLFFENLDKDGAAIGYAMFTGNTEFINTSTMDSFRYGGVAHVFAVSGQHISLIYVILTFFLKKLRAPKVPSAIFSIAVVFFYTGVCGFTLSAVRSAIMCAVMSAIRLMHGKYDGLSSVAISFVVITLVDPLNIISIGFLLSVAAVAGIAVFNGGIGRVLSRAKLPSPVVSAVSVSLSAQIATFPILISGFGYVSWASLGMNIIFVPVISAIFTLMFPCTLLALVIPPLARLLLLVYSVPLDLVTSALVSVHAENALISGFDFGAFAPLYFAAAFVLSEKVDIGAKWRMIVAFVLAAVLAAGVVLKNYVPAGGVKIVVSGYYGGSGAVLFKTGEGNVLVVSETPSSYDITSLLSENAAEELEAVIILGGEESLFAYNLLGKECGELYVNYTNINFQPYRGVTVHYERRFDVCGISFSYVTGNDVVADCKGVTVGISCGEDVHIDGCDLLVAQRPSDGAEFGRAVYFQSVNFADNVYDCGDLQFIVKDGIISERGPFRVKGRT